MRAWRSLAKFRGESKLRSWLYTVAANVGRSELSRRKTLKRHGETVSFDEGTRGELSKGDPGLTSFAGPLEELLSKEEVTVLRQQIEKLPPRMLRILLLRLDQGLKLREIAVLEKVSINTVKSQLSQAKLRLKP